MSKNMCTHCRLQSVTNVKGPAQDVPAVARPVRLQLATIKLATIVLAVVCWNAAISSAWCADPESTLDFNRDIRPILSDTCYRCHGPDSANRKADLRLDKRDAAIDAGAIKPGNVDESTLLERVFSDDPSLVMPPASSHKSLTDAQKQTLRKWIEEGAEYRPHWSLIPVPKTIAVPEVRKDSPAAAIVRNPIDAFVAAELNKLNIRPAAEASRETWIRRASLDLTGLPPTLEELDAFLADTSESAYETVVDRLLASPAFGERMATDWLDLARFADTFGYQADRDMHMWPYRDWVISSFNNGLSYRDFIVWQTAGDLLPNPTREQYLATAFNRLHRQTNEGGSIEAEFRQEYVSDRVHTNGTAFLGLTLECCRCHDHKYDPLSQRDYYQLSAFFNSIDEHGLYSHFTETAPTPALLLYEGDQEAQHRDLLAKVARQWETTDGLARDAWRRFDHGERPAAPADPVVRPPQHSFNFDTATAAGDYTVVPGKQGQSLEFGGDDAFVCAGAGVFNRVTPFSLTMWLKAREHKPRMIVLHRAKAAEDSAFRGYSVELDSGHVSVSLVHFWPGNAIRVRSRNPIPVDTWSHVSVTYDGHSRASGVGLFIDGRKVDVEVIRDALTRDFVHRAEWGDDAGGVELALGARFRDVGFKHGQIDELNVFNVALTPLEVAHYAGVSAPVDDNAIFEDYKARYDAAWQAADAELLRLQSEENNLVSSVRQIMVMREMPQPRQTYVLQRGAYDSPGDPVTAATPASLPPMSENAPRNRLGLAQWLVDDTNPLVSRVAVNRFWSIFFGRGIVVTNEDFGSQGQLPTHPLLLDWLSRQFMDDDWNVKRLCKLIVLSGTYRQSSIPVDRKLLTDDPDNRLLARGPRYRLSAEQIRDQALAVSGLLVKTVGGPSVMPYQPAGLWEEAGTGKSYSQSHGDGLHRRSLYTFWRRTAPPPSMTTFDATTREVCTPRRERTATPLQSLVLMNDPQFVEASRSLAEKLMLEFPDDAAKRISSAFRRCTSRLPTAREIEILTGMYNEQRAAFGNETAAATRYLSIGEAPRNQSLNVVDHAATTVVVNAIFSFDECAMKR